MAKKIGKIGLKLNEAILFTISCFLIMFIIWGLGLFIIERQCEVLVLGWER